jgi:hypothetical protein
VERNNALCFFFQGLLPSCSACHTKSGHQALPQFCLLALVLDCEGFAHAFYMVISSVYLHHTPAASSR